MSLFKKLLSRLVENEQTVDGSGFDQYLTQTPRSAHSDFGLFRDDPDQLKRIQAFVNAYLGGSYIEPEAAINLLRSKLNHAGLDFDFNSKTKLSTGSHSFQLNRYGEIFGTTPTHDLLKNGFDKGKEYVPLTLSFTLTGTPTGKMYFTDIQITKSGLIDQAENNTPTPQVEEQYDESGEMLMESKDMGLSVMNMIMKNPKIKTKVIEPVFRSLVVMKGKKKLTHEEATTRLTFAAKSAVRKLAGMGKINKSKVDDALIKRVSNHLMKKFKGMKTLSGE